MTFDLKWPARSDATLHLPAAGEVHLWRTDLDAGAEDFPGALSSAEQARARQFKAVEHRRRYVHARTWLRQILGRYLRITPGEVALEIDGNGKPFIGEATNSAKLHFNLSHSANFGLLAVMTGHKVGVDVQIESAKNDWPSIAARYFTVRELEHVRALPEKSQPAACVEIWTRKEAAGKALGIGLHSKTFSFSVGPAAWGKVRCDENLCVRSLPVEAPFAAAVACVQ